MHVRFVSPAQRFGFGVGLRRSAAPAVAAALAAAALVGCERQVAHDPAAQAAADQALIGPEPARMPTNDPKPEPAWKCVPRAVAEFGEVPLDTPVADFPWGGRSDLKAQCTQECSFTWRDGIEYVADGEFVFQKFLYVGRTETPMPLGLTAASDMAAARAALSQHDPEVSTDPDRWRDITGEEPPFKEGDVVSALLCPSEADINLHFDAAGRLRVVRLRANTSGT